MSYSSKPSSCQGAAPTGTAILAPLFAAIDSHSLIGRRDAVVFQLMVETGIWPIQIYSLTTDHYRNNWLSIPEEFGLNARTIALPPDLASKMDLYVTRIRPQFVPMSEYMFATADGGPLTVSVIRRRFQAYCARAGYCEAPLNLANYFPNRRS